MPASRRKLDDWSPWQRPRHNCLSWGASFVVVWEVQVAVGRWMRPTWVSDVTRAEGNARSRTTRRCYCQVAGGNVLTSPTSVTCSPSTVYCMRKRMRSACCKKHKCTYFSRAFCVNNDRIQLRRTFCGFVTLICCVTLPLLLGARKFPDGESIWSWNDWNEITTDDTTAQPQPQLGWRQDDKP